MSLTSRIVQMLPTPESKRTFPAADLTMTPGTLLFAASNGKLSKKRGDGFAQHFGLNRRFRGGEDAYFGPCGVDRAVWEKVARPWMMQLVEALGPMPLVYISFMVSSMRGPFQGVDADASAMPEAWRRFGATLHDFVLASGFWEDDGDGTMHVNVNLKVYGDGDKPTDGYMNMSRDLRLHRILGPAMIAKGQAVAALCPAWFTSLGEMALKFTLPKPSAEAVAAAQERQPEIARLCTEKLPIDLYWKPGKGKPRPDHSLFHGWDALIDAHCFVERHRDALFRIDPWRPEWLVWLKRDFGDLFSSAKKQAIAAWCEANCQGRHRHMFAAIYEFEREDDARAFDARWRDEPGDAEPDDIFC